MFEKGQSVFRITVNNGVVDGILFKVEEFFISDLTGGPYPSATLVNKSGEVCDTKILYGFNKLVSKESNTFNHGCNVYVSDILSLDKYLADLFDLVQDNVEKILVSLKSELDLLEESPDSYLIQRGLDFTSILNKKEALFAAIESEQVSHDFAIKTQFSLNERSFFNTSIELGTYRVNSDIDLEDLILDAEGESDTIKYYQSYLEDPTKKSVNFYSFRDWNEEVHLEEWSEHTMDSSFEFIKKETFSNFLFTMTKIFPIDINSEVLLSESSIYWVKNNLRHLLNEYYRIYLDYSKYLSLRSPNQLVDQFFID